MDVLKIDFGRIYDLKKKKSAVLSLADDIIVFDDESLADIDLASLEDIPPVRIDARVYLLCRHGEITFDVNYKTFRLTKGSMFRLNGRHIISNIRISADYKGYTLIFSNDFLLSIISWVPELKELVVCADRFKPFMLFDDVELQKFIDIIEHLKNSLKTAGHTFHNRLVKLEATCFILELADSFARKVSNKGISAGKENRGEEVLQQFMLLVMEHCKEQHEVSFYANRLNMTSGNLSRIITKASGKSPLKWINDVLIAEAKILLRNPDMNVQQVSHELHFGDQSSFGKFFRKHMGVTPLDYKSNNRKVELF